MNYTDFLAVKRAIHQPSGFAVDMLHPRLFPFQAAIVRRCVRLGRSAIFADTGMGKCHGKGTPILMHDGSIKAIEDVRVGDMVMGDDSTPRRVLRLYRGQDNLYRVKPVKGDAWVCNTEHILSLKITCDYRQYARDEIINISVRDYLQTSSTFKHIAKLWRTAVDFPARSVPYDPYFIGVWLGDGHIREPAIATVDPEVVVEVYDFALKHGLQVRVATSRGCPSYHLSSQERFRGSNPLRNYLQASCVCKGEKRIPRDYMTNDWSTRLEMLAGMIDTDGYLVDGVYEITTKFAGLRDDILFLARSLGFGATSREKVSRIKSSGFQGVYHRIFICGDIDRIPCRVFRRKAAPRRQKKSPLKTGFSLESLGQGEYYGFELDGSHLYLLGDFTVTHNTGMSLEWAAQIAEATYERVLIICPLAVAWQFTEEARHFGLNVPYVRSQAEAETAGSYICVTNYDMVNHFDPSRWIGAVLDEASSLKNHTGAFRSLMMQMWRDTPYKLAQTATPSPNTPTEILEIAEWLGIMDTGQALTRWFLRDSNKANQLRLKGHAAPEYYRWLTSWAVALTKPSDIGPYSDDGYELPGLRIIPHLVDVDYVRWQEQGQLLPNGKRSAVEMWADKRETLTERVNLAAELATSNALPWVVWVSTDAESKAVAELLGNDTVEVRGSQSTAEKERRLRGFADGTYRVIVTKPSIASLGLNWQHCHQMVFASIDFSFEKRYQAIRRCYRFRQQHEVQAHVISTETESNIQQAIAEKEQQHRELIGQMVRAMRATGLDLDGQRLGLEDYEPQTPLVLPAWLRSTA